MTETRLDYLNRPACANCGHTRALHEPGRICFSAHCYCTHFVDEVTDAEAKATEGLLAEIPATSVARRIAELASDESVDPSVNHKAAQFIAALKPQEAS